MKNMQISRRLVLEWQALTCRMHALRKAFISVKGFYLQAEIHTVNITWLMPHATSQILPKDVDMRVMLTFLEFYHSLLRFVMFKLYHDLGLKYPPVVRPETESISAELADIIKELSGAQRSAEEQIEATKDSMFSTILAHSCDDDDLNECLSCFWHATCC
jgi:pescadillo